jgi:hypothetical protein
MGTVRAKLVQVMNGERTTFHLSTCRFLSTFRDILCCCCCCCCCWWSGPEAKAPVALQPLGLLYTLFSRSSQCRRQMSPHPTRRERSKQREVELQWARKSSREFCLNADFHVTFRNLLHAVNLRRGTAGFTSPPREGVLGIFSPWKIRRLRPGLNPRTWVLEASSDTLCDLWSDEDTSFWLLSDRSVVIQLKHLPHLYWKTQWTSPFRGVIGRDAKGDNRCLAQPGQI